MSRVAHLLIALGPLAHLPIALAPLALGLSGCHHDSSSEPRTSSPTRPLAGPAAAPNLPRTYELIPNLSRCEARHRGHLFDLGSPSVDGLRAWSLEPDPDVTNVEREGATWARIASRQVTYNFLVDDAEQAFISARIRGVVSKSAQVFLDGKAVGTLSFSRNQTRVVSTPLVATTLTPGRHTIGLRFSGSLHATSEPFAEVDWLRVGVADDDPSAYAAPTLSDITQSKVAFGGVPRSALALRAPGVVRCTVGVPANAHLTVSTGLLGGGEGEAEIRILSDDHPAEILRDVRVLGGDHPAWTDLDLPLAAYAGRIVTIELGAAAATRGARVVFGDPSVVGRDMPDVASPRAKAVIIVVVSALDPARLPPLAPDKPLPTFDSLAREGAVFDRDRSPTTVTAGVLASMLTGLVPAQHAVEDDFSRIPDLLPTLATVARDASVRTDMSSSNPATFEAFGFSRGWDRFDAHPPTAEALGIAPIEDLVAWISQLGEPTGRGILGVAHTRGIHPPFDMSPGEFAQLPPSDYSGILDPRRAGQSLERMRGRKSRVKLADADRRRLSGMIDAALVETDRGLSNLIDALRKAGLWNDTLLIVTSDVAAAADPIAVPFGAGLDITEETLHVPLYVHFPGGAFAGTRIGGPATATDIARTAVAALDIDMPGALGGIDLFRIASRDITPVERPLTATLGGRFATRWADFRLVGRSGNEPFLCDLSKDVRCEKDLHDALPVTTMALWRSTYDELARARATKPHRDPATIDTEIAAYLAAWGR